MVPYATGGRLLEAGRRGQHSHVHIHMDQQIQPKSNRQYQRNPQIAWGKSKNAGRTGRYRASSQYPAPTQSEMDAKKIEQLVSLTKRLLKEQTNLRASLARTNQALGVSI